jgi:hypothetical protein
MQNIDRRKFIGRTALAGLGLASAGALITACKRKPDINALGLPPILKGAPKGKKLRLMHVEKDLLRLNCQSRLRTAFQVLTGIKS